jgi:hypothetical protein
MRNELRYLLLVWQDLDDRVTGNVKVRQANVDNEIEHAMRFRVEGKEYNT